MIRNLTHVVLALLLLAFTFNGVWFIAVPLFLWYVFRYPAYELIFMAAAIDVYFLPAVGVWWYTIMVTVVVVFGSLVRPNHHREYGFYD